MSRTYRNKIRIGICYGNNTQFYRDRNKSTRRKNRHILKNNDISDDLEFVTNKSNKNFDKWTEPTDGSWLCDATYIQKRLNRINEPQHNKLRIPYDLWDYKSLKKFYHKLKSVHLKNR